MIFRTLLATLCLFVLQAEASYDAHAIANGSLVLVRSNSNLAAFVISEQINTPTGQAKYEWLLFEKEESSNGWIKEQSGIGRTGDIPKSFLFIEYVALDPIEIGPFKLYWSSRGHGQGWVYFRYFSKIQPGDYCISENEKLENALQVAKDCFGLF